MQNCWGRWMGRCCWCRKRSQSRKAAKQHWWRDLPGRVFAHVSCAAAFVAILLPTSALYAQDALACGELVYPASGAAAAPTVARGTNLVSVGESLYFISHTETDATAASGQLWRTDGTPTGTFTITPSVAEFTPLYLFTALDDKFLLRAATPGAGAELWISDGTAAGTRLLKDVTPGPADTTYQSSWVIVDNRLFFAVYAEDRSVWWTTDGTPAGTVPAATIYPGVMPENAALLAQSPTVAYLVATGADQQVELWHLDRNGFTKIKEFGSEPASRAESWIGQAFLQQERLYFFAHVVDGASGLWRSDGTAAGTELIVPKEFVVQADPTRESGVYPYMLLATTADALFFFEYDQPLLRLWRLDQAREQASLVKTLRLRNEDGLYYDLQLDTAVAYKEKIYFSFWWHDPQRNLHQSEVWTSDGTAIGTYRLTLLPLAARLAFGAGQGLFLLGDPYVVYIPWLRPYPTVICNLGLHTLLSPTLFAHNGDVYVSGRNAWQGTEHLWRLDPTTLRPTNVFLPGIAR